MLISRHVAPPRHHGNRLPETSGTFDESAVTVCTTHNVHERQEVVLHVLLAVESHHRVVDAQQDFDVVVVLAGVAAPPPSSRRLVDLLRQRVQGAGDLQLGLCTETSERHGDTVSLQSPLKSIDDRNVSRTDRRAEFKHKRIQCFKEGRRRSVKERKRRLYDGKVQFQNSVSEM